MDYRLVELQTEIDELRSFARKAIDQSQNLENEAESASLLRNRIELMLVSLDEMIGKIDRMKTPVNERQDSRQSTEESVRLAFSGMYTH